MGRGKAIGAEVFTGFAGIAAIEKAAKARQLAARAVKAGAKVVQGAAKAKAPRGKTGLLKRSLGLKAKKGSRGKTLAFAVVGARTKVEKVVGKKKVKPSKYAHLVERGTRPHSVAKRGTVGGKQHPGARPKPFLEPALRGSKDAAARAMLAAAEVELKKYLGGVKDKRGGRR